MIIMKATGFSICLLLLFCACFAFATKGVNSESPFVPVCNVKDYGAIGDGMADDSLAVQNAMQNCALSASNGALMYFPLGVYKLTSNSSTTFEFSFFFQECNSSTTSSSPPQNAAVTFVGEINAAGVRARISWIVADGTPQANLFTVISCSNFEISNLDVHVLSTPIAPIILSTQYNAGVTISDVHWQTTIGSPNSYAIAISATSVSNLQIQNSIFEDATEVALIFSECSEVIILQVTVQSSYESSNSEAISIQGGLDFQFDGIVVSDYSTGMVLWSETKENAAFQVTHSTFTVNEAIVVYNNISLTVTSSVFNSPSANASTTLTSGISIQPSAKPCIIVNNSTFSFFTGAAIQNTADRPITESSNGSSQKRDQITRTGCGLRTSDSCPLLTVQDSLFDLNSLDLILNANSWQLLANICISNDRSQLQCTSSIDCVQSNNIGCDFIPPGCSQQQHQRSTAVVLRED